MITFNLYSILQGRRSLVNFNLNHGLKQKGLRIPKIRRHYTKKLNSVSADSILFLFFTLLTVCRFAVLLLVVVLVIASYILELVVHS
jgi:hypothetical protein